MRRPIASFLAAAVLAGCAHRLPSDCHIESGWLDATNGCSARAGYPDCYQVCPNGVRVRVQNSSDLARPPQTSPPKASAPPADGAAPQQNAAPAHP